MIENDTDSQVAPGESEAAGAPGNEIEITPEMIEAGRKVILDEISDFGPTGAKILASGVIEAALKARCGNHASE